MGSGHRPASPEWTHEAEETPGILPLILPEAFVCGLLRSMVPSSRSVEKIQRVREIRWEKKYILIFLASN